MNSARPEIVRRQAWLDQKKATLRDNGPRLLEIANNGPQNGKDWEIIRMAILVHIGEQVRNSIERRDIQNQNMR